jgi:CheY-like chemotaxis protein
MMLSSADRPNSTSRCQELGIDTFLVKPVSASTLLEAILAALGSRPRGGGEQGADHVPESEVILAENPKRELHVLVADDHEPNRNLAMKILERRGHRCVPAGDGDEAIAACAQNSFDAVLMDVQMPNCDGFSATRAIRDRESRIGAHVPIIALTAHALSGDREECLSAGMDAYLAKPIHARELVALVERVTGVSPDGDGDITPRQGPIRTSPFDISAALDRMDGEMDLLKEHIGYVLNDIPKLVERMRAAINRNDARLLEISGHRLKSLVSSYNHDSARELAQSLEQMGKAGQFDQAATTLDQLQPLIDEFIKAVQHYLKQQK